MHGSWIGYNGKLANGPNGNPPMLLRDGVTHHPKLLTVGAEAAWLWVAAIDYARAHLTDGFIPRAVLTTLGVFRTRVDRLADQLVQVRLFVATDGGYTINDFLEHNDSKVEVARKQALAAERKAAWRAKHEERTENAPVPLGQTRDTPVTRARAYPHLGVGVGTVSGTQVFSEGEREGKPAPIDATPTVVATRPGSPLADDVWQLWRATAAQHGTDIRLAASHTETLHLLDLAAAYTLDDLTPAVQAWWASAHTGGRSLGLFKSQVADVLTAPIMSP